MPEAIFNHSFILIVTEREKRRRKRYGKRQGELNYFPVVILSKLHHILKYSVILNYLEQALWSFSKNELVSFDLCQLIQSNLLHVRFTFQF